MSDAEQVGFLFELPGLSAGIDDERTPRQAPTDFLHAPKALHTGQLRVEHTDVEHPVTEQRFGFNEVRAVHDPMLLGIECAANGLGQPRMLSKDEYGLH